MVEETQRGAKMTRCAIYSRVSTSKQESDNQLVQLRNFASTMGWHVVAEYVDQVTGKHADRPEFQHMFGDASQRRFDVLLFWSLDRLSREGALETLQHLNRLTGYGIQWRSLTEQYLDSTGMFREAVISILAVVAKQERIRLSERTRAGQSEHGGRESPSDARESKLMQRKFVKCVNADCLGEQSAERPDSHELPASGR